MTARRDPDRLIRTYLDDGPTELADRSYDAVRDQIDHTRQRVVLGPWREPWMSKLMPLGLVTAAVLVVAVVIGINLMPQGGQFGGPGPASTASPTQTSPPSPAASPSETPAPTASDAAIRLPAVGPLAAGTYYIDERSITQADRFTFTVPAGWTTTEGFLYKDRFEAGEVMLVTWIVTHIFTDACLWEGKLVNVGTTVDELVDALAAQGGREVTAGPTDVTLGGFQAKRIELTVPEDLDVSTCSTGNLRYWPDPGPDLSGGLWRNPAGNTDVVYVVDVNDRRLVVVARHYPESSEQNRAELQAIVDSIQIEP